MKSDYADDPTVFKRRGNPLRSEILEQWGKLVSSGRFSEPTPVAQNWTSQSSAAVTWDDSQLYEKASIPKWKKRVVGFMSSRGWDYGYFFGLFVWLAVFSAVQDDLASFSQNSSQNALLLIPFLCALIPAIGAIIVSLCCKSTVYVLGKHDIARWSINFCLSCKLFQLKSRPVQKLSQVAPDSHSASGPAISDIENSTVTSVATSDRSLNGRNCIVCGRPREDESSSSSSSVTAKTIQSYRLVFETRGEFVKRNVVRLVNYESDAHADKDSLEPRERSPRRKAHKKPNAKQIVPPSKAPHVGKCCGTCGTPYSYKPRKSTAHVFDRKFQAKTTIMSKSIARRLRSDYMLKNFPEPDPLLFRVRKDEENDDDVMTLHEIEQDFSWKQWASDMSEKSKVFMFGLDKTRKAPLLWFDWRLPLYLGRVIPQVPRRKLDDNMRYNIGDEIESNHQKTEWCRGWVLQVRDDDKYDIRYETGEDVRFVEGRSMRFCTDKYSQFICVLEAYFLLFFILWPLIGVISPTPAVAAVLISLCLLIESMHTMGLWIKSSLAIFHKHWEIGCMFHFHFFAFYASPSFLLFVFSLSVMGAGTVTPFSGLVFLTFIVMMSIISFTYKTLYGLIIFSCGMLFVVFIFMYTALLTSDIQYSHIIMNFPIFVLILVWLFVIIPRLSDIWEPRLVAVEQRVVPITEVKQEQVASITEAKQEQIEQA